MCLSTTWSVSEARFTVRVGDKEVSNCRCMASVYGSPFSSPPHPFGDRLNQQTHQFPEVEIILDSTQNYKALNEDTEELD